MKPSVRPKQSREGETTAATATVAMVATKVKQQQSHRKSFRFLKALGRFEDAAYDRLTFRLLEIYLALTCVFLLSAVSA